MRPSEQPPGDPMYTGNADLSNALDRIRKKHQSRGRWLVQASIAEHKYVPASNTVDYTFLVEAGPLVEITVEGFRVSRSTIKKNVPAIPLQKNWPAEPENGAMP